MKPEVPNPYWKASRVSVEQTVCSQLRAAQAGLQRQASHLTGADTAQSCVRKTIRSISPVWTFGLAGSFPTCTRTEAFPLLHGSLALVTWSWQRISTMRRNLTACCSHALLNRMSVPTLCTKLREAIKGQRDRLLIGTTVKLHFSILGSNKGLQLLKVGQDFGCMPHAGIRKHRH